MTMKTAALSERAHGRLKCRQNLDAAVEAAEAELAQYLR
jgi:hypothetical protein